MLNIRNLRIFITDATGKSHECNEERTEHYSVSLRAEKIHGGWACFVTGTCAVGFSGQESILLRPEVMDTSDYLAIINHSDYWSKPFWGESLSGLPHQTQELLIRNGETYSCILPVCSDTFKTAIRGCQGGFEFLMYSNCEGITECRDQLAFLYMESHDPMKLLHDCAEKAADLLGNGLKMREEKSVAELFDYLGWCSWDAFQIRVSHNGLLEKAEEFRQKQIPVHYAIIDDMWADIPGLNDLPADIPFDDMVRAMHASRMRSFAGDPTRFPQGMNTAIADLKQAGIPKIGVWFPTTGYWSGFTADGEVAQSQEDNLTVTSAGQIIVSPDEEKAEKLFGEFCRRIDSWGGDFVKIDNQGYHKRYRDLKPIGESARAIQRAIDHVTGEIFDGALINCMGMPSECMFNRPESAISRCSDDFMPESREWFAKNILQCSYNGLLQGQYYVNDWDMWWTDDEQASKNSLCRAISGGPIYVSDKLGRTSPEILRPLILRDGRILRCDDSATPTEDCLMADPTATGKIFKIRNRVGNKGIAAVFNIDVQNRAVSGTVRATDTGLADLDYVYYEYFTGECGILGAGNSLNITLQTNDDFRLYSFIPYNPDGITVIGRTDLFIGVKAVKEQSSDTVTLVEGGKVGFVSGKPVRVFSDVREINVETSGLLSTVDLHTDETVLHLK